MTVSAPVDRDEPRPKVSMPPLDTRAPRPSVVRLRRGVVVGVVMAGASLVGGALTWAFVVQPELRSRAHHAGLEDPPNEVRGAVHPSEKVTSGPASYADMGRLPKPRRLGGNSDQAPDRTAPRRSASPKRTTAGNGAGGAGAGEDARTSALFFTASAPGGPAPSKAFVAERGGSGDYGAVYNTHALLPPLSPYEVKAGAVIAAALLTGVDTSRPGPVTAAVTENVFDTVSGRYLLIPQGSRLVGHHEGESRYGDRRAFISWERLILPNGKSLVLPKEPGVDAQGAVGSRGDVDRRLIPLAVATVFAGAITSLGQLAQEHDGNAGGFLGDVGDAAAIEAAQVGGKLIDRELQVHPVVRIQPGASVRIFVTHDLILEPYQP